MLFTGWLHHLDLDNLCNLPWNLLNPACRYNSDFWAQVWNIIGQTIFGKMLNVHCIWWKYLMYNLIQVFLIKTSFTINRTLIHIFCFIYYFRYGGTIYGFLFTSDIINNLLVKSILHIRIFCVFKRRTYCVLAYLCI